MKCKELEKIAPVQPTRAAEYIITAQRKKSILIMDVFLKGTYEGRHAVNIDTGEYMQYIQSEGKWKQRKFGNLLGLDMTSWGWADDREKRKRTNFDTEEMQQMVEGALLKMSKIYFRNTVFDMIDSAEAEYAREKRRRIEDNRVLRVQDKMKMVPAMPEKARQWIWEQEGKENAIFWDKDTRKWHCTCGKTYSDSKLQEINQGKKIRHNGMVTCPGCGLRSMAKTRTDCIKKKTHFAMMQRIDDRMSVVRYFDVTMLWTPEGREIRINEAVRIILYRLNICPKYAGEIFYNQYSTDGISNHGRWDHEAAYFDNKHNPAQRREAEGYLYPEGIEEALNGTACRCWGPVMSQLAAAGQKLDYNRMLSTQNKTDLASTVEYLFKGRFYKLLKETAQSIFISWNTTYCGPLQIDGETIEEIFSISSRQLINRIREVDGGADIVEWMRMSDQTGAKISQETLEWLSKNGIAPADIRFIADRMSPQQTMNYVSRQQAGEYKGKTAKTVISQWYDYLQMLKTLDKKADDEMMYRPRELKRRHNECVEEINRWRIREEMERDAEKREKEARKMRERFPGAEEILQEIKNKYEYANDRYLIKVPRTLVEIIQEGSALHHCAGATDRYFDRIMQRETYICFLRRAADPETPYYTIEIEPGGTIRQHRGYCDEEPGIEEIKPFLKEWQREIKKRISQKDREYAAVSAVKRQENIEELRAKNNTRVLKGLLEDFMEEEDAV